MEATTAATLRWLSKIEKRLDCVVEYNAPSVVTEVESFRNAYIFMKNKGVKVKWVTEITKDNRGYCKEAMNVCGVKIRHLKGRKGTFAVSEKEYVCYNSNDGESKAPANDDGKLSQDVS